MNTPEQEARDMLERMGVEDAQSWSSGEVVELANVLARLAEAERLLREGSQYALAPHSVGQSMLLVQWAEYVESQYGDRDSATSETVRAPHE